MVLDRAMDRRTLCGGLAMAPLAMAPLVIAGCASPVTAAALGDASNAGGTGVSPLESFVRIRSSEYDRRSYWWYSGQMMARRTGTTMRPLLTVTGLSQTICSARADGNVDYDLVEAGYYGAVGADGIADGAVTNTLTGAPMTPEHYLSPQKLMFTQDMAVQPRAPLPPAIEFTGMFTAPDCKGPRVWMSEQLFVTMPDGSGTGGTRIANSLANFEAGLADVQRGTGFVPASLQYTTLNSFRPWMNMGDASGDIMMRLNAVKLSTYGEVPAALRDRVAADHPGTFA